MSFPSERARSTANFNIYSSRWSLEASSGWPSEPAANPWRMSDYVVAPPRQFPRPAWDHAAPLAAIPGRDLQEMQNWFDRGDMSELEADLNHLLARLLPEPAWDDDAWLFLQECEAAIDSTTVPMGIGHRFDAYIA